MRKALLVVLMVLVLAVCLSSCRQDIDYVLGRWEYEGYDNYYTADVRIVLEFKKDNTVTVVRYHNGEEFLSSPGTFSTTSKTSGTILIEEELSEYTLSGNRLTIGDKVFGRK